MKIIQVVFGMRKEGGVEFQSDISFADTTPEFKNITLSKVDEVKSLYKIFVEKNVNHLGRNELKSVVEEATTEAQKFVYVFSAAADIKIFDFNCEGYQYEGLFHNINELYREGTEIRASGTITVGASSKNVDELKEKMKLKYDLSKLRMFYDSATITEPISRFISLYALMLHTCSDNQTTLDEAILKIDKTVAQYEQPKKDKNQKKTKYETVFTKLRNELAHKRDEVNVLETHNQIRKNIERFERIVKIHFLDT